jgi:hypothetical protein
MAFFKIRVELLDADGRVVETDWANGNTDRTVKAAAEALGNQMQSAHDDTHPVTTVRLGRRVKG